MRTVDAKDALLRFLTARGIDVAALDARTAATSMIEWYQADTFEDLTSDTGADMLLFQWGTYDWGERPSFEFDLVRQLVLAEASDEDSAIWQLHLTLHFAPDPAAVEESLWCSSREVVSEFRAAIASRPVIEQLQHQPLHATEILFEEAG